MQWIWASQQIGWDLYSFTYRVRRSEVSASCSDAQSCSQIFRSRTTEYKQLTDCLSFCQQCSEMKTRAKAGEARALVPCALELARKYLDPVISQEEAMLHAAEALNSMYTCLSSAAWDQAVFRDAAQRYLLLAGQLEAFFEEDKIFRVKPKAHQLVELARHDVNPSKIWTYRDESYGHTLALLGRRRGGKFSMRAVSCQV